MKFTNKMTTTTTTIQKLYVCIYLLCSIWTQFIRFYYILYNVICHLLCNLQNHFLFTISAWCRISFCPIHIFYLDLFCSSSFLFWYRNRKKKFGLSFCSLNFFLFVDVWVCAFVLVHSFISGNDVPKYEFKMRKWEKKHDFMYWNQQRSALKRSRI